MATALQVIGSLAIAIAGAILHPALGIAIFGVASLLFGIAVERMKDRD